MDYIWKYMSVERDYIWKKFYVEMDYYSLEMDYY